MKLVNVNIDELIPDPNNARLHSEKNLESIKVSLHEFGQRRPIVITPGKIVIAGNGTLEAAKRLGWSQIIAVITSTKWTPEQIKAYALADNRTAELATWKGELLSAQLEQLADLGWDRADLGFVLPGSPDVKQNPTREIDLDSFEFEHSCPDCGFEFNG